MKHILILGATGRLGKVVVQMALKRQYEVTALVRNPKKLNIAGENLHVIQGNVTSPDDLSHVLSRVDTVISTLGHGFRTSYPIQEKTLHALLPLMEKRHIHRFITVTGAGLKVKGDPQSFIADISEKLFQIVDPFRMDDARSQQHALEKSSLDWTVVRTPIHNNTRGTITHIGFTQPPMWATLSRVAIAAFMIDCIENPLWIKKSPIIY
jgi:putative NADH-flavin reductase